MCRKIVLNLLRFLSLSIGSLLGAGSCFHSTLYGPPMYGEPYADYTISGTVLSSDQVQPVSGLLVSLRDTTAGAASMDSVLTDSLGMYALKFSSYPEDHFWLVQVKDIDSTAHGYFRTLDTVVSVPRSDLRDSTGIYKGHAEIDVDLKVQRNGQ